jgi:hypothetical protein
MDQKSLLDVIMTVVSILAIVGIVLWAFGMYG